MKRSDCIYSFAGMLAIFIGIWFSVCVPPAAADELRARALWKQFREAFPNHLQIVALSERDRSNERVLLISEPPPWFGGNDLQRALKDYMGVQFRGSLALHHPMGVDGWVTDLLVRFESRPGDEVLVNSRVNQISEDLFGTTYKAGALDLPVIPPNDVQAPPNISPRATELKQWLFGDQVNLTSLTTGDQSQLKKLLCDGRPDTYFTDNIGLVILLLPVDAPIDPFLFAFRHFAIDTDAILGAISVAGCNRVAVIGRERTTSLVTMPPLRTEVFLRIAATKKKELGQSYERTAPFAGKLIRGDGAGLDWAPIYLSDDLLNTEFGSLLNLTDQMLKSWSEAGNIEYVRFRYPKPRSFPFVQGAAKYLNASALTYNWNTTGVGSVTSFDDVRIFTVLNTGSLPVSFLPEGQDRKNTVKRTAAAEEMAYKYFMGLRDPNLATVVELAALYQIFQVFPVRVGRDELVSHSPPGLVVSRSKATSEILRSIAERPTAVSNLKVDLVLMVEAVEAGVPADLAPLLTSKELPSEVAKLLQSSADLVAMRDKLLAARARLISEQAAELGRVKSELLRLKQLFSDDIFDLIAKLMNDRSLDLTAGIARLEQFGWPTDTTIDLAQKVRSASKPDRDLALLALLQLELREGFFSDVQDAIWWVGDVEDAKKQYQSQAVNTPQIFIKTPTIVLSANREERLSVGGHNLYGRSTSVVVDAAVPRGTVARTTVGDVTALRVNPGDASASSEIARAFERNSNASEQELSAALGDAARSAEPPRALASALQMSPADLARTERGASEAAEGKLPMGMSGWKVSVDRNSTLRAVQRAAGQYQVEIEKDGASYIFHRLVPAPPSSIRVLSPAEFPIVFKAVAERVANSNVTPGRLVVRATNLSSQEVRGLADTLAAGGGSGGTRFVGGTEFGIPEAHRPWSAWLFKRGENARYTRVNDDGQVTLLELSGKVENVRPRLEQSLDWSRATVEQAKSVAVEGSSLRGLRSESWDLTIPVSNEPTSFIKTQIVALFRKLLSKAEKDDLNNIITKSVRTNAEASLSALDGIAELKADILRLAKVKPEAIKFHFFDGSNDISIAKIEGPDGGSMAQ